MTRSRPPRALLATAARVHGDIRGRRAAAWEAVFAIARRIPRGRVMTYGQIATLIENRLSPRAVGWALHGCPEDVPWQRVVNASGGCSTERLPDIPAGLQRAMLEAEGVVFSPSGTLDLARYRWVPTPPRRRPSPRPRRGASGAR
ncbi:MAG: MGMT family protein [Acidobacteriia bacterium]|nr:MGMT family protein [Terriglobia bacterium]